MDTFFKKKWIAPFVTVLPAICCIGGTALVLTPVRVTEDTEPKDEFLERLEGGGVV